MIIYQLENLNHYFPSISTTQYDWIRNPFVETTTEFNLTLTEEGELAGLSTDRGLIIKHKEMSIEAFWISIKEEYVSLSKTRRLYYYNFQHHIYVNFIFT